jgi:hypothetical protein
VLLATYRPRGALASEIRIRAAPGHSILDGGLRYRAAIPSPGHGAHFFLPDPFPLADASLTGLPSEAAAGDPSAL